MSLTYCINLWIKIWRFVVLASNPTTSKQTKSVYIVNVIMFGFVNHGLMIEVKFELKIWNFFFVMNITEESKFIFFTFQLEGLAFWVP